MPILRLAGRCADGAERDGGSLFHIVPDGWKALCGAKPGKHSVGWSPYEGASPTCIRCVSKQQKAEDRELMARVPKVPLPDCRPIVIPELEPLAAAVQKLSEAL